MQRPEHRNCPSILSSSTSASGLRLCPREVKRMLGQRVDISALKSQTLPRFDGFDEEGETLENQFEIMSIVNSCPDLSLVIPHESQSGLNNERGNSPNSSNLIQDNVDGFFYKTASMAPSKLPLSFRRSTSLSSLEAEAYPREVLNTVDGNVPGVLQAGSVAKAVGQLEQTFKNEQSRQQINPNDFIRSTQQRASYNGSGFLHKSVSSPSVVPHFFGAIPTATEERSKHPGLLESRHHHSTASQQHSSKRSFFRRGKNKDKGGSLNSGPPNSKQNKKNPERMNGASFSDDSLGYIALTDPALGLQEPDTELWTMTMSPEVVSKLSEKEIKRQEHMYEVIQTEKHHCLILALMHFLFLGDMKRAGFRRQARLIFPCLNDLLQVHFSFLREMRERQLRFREMNEPLDSLASLLVTQFTKESFNVMIRCYGILYTSNEKSLELIKQLKGKEQKFASLVEKWGKTPLLGRKNVPECLLLVAQRITKYPLLIQALIKTSNSAEERDELIKAADAAKSLNSRVNERVYERQKLSEICMNLDSKSITTDGTRRIRREDLLLVPSRRLLFQGQAIANCNRLIGGTVSTSSGSGGPLSARNGPCNVLILTDSIVLIQEISGRHYFASPPGIVMFNNNLIIRENAGHNSSLFIMYGAAEPEMIELQVIIPRERDTWLDVIKDAIVKYQENGEIGSDVEDDAGSETMEFSDIRTTRALEELQEQDKQILALLKSRSKIIETLRAEKPYHWTNSSLEGKYDVLNSISKAATEVQNLLSHMDANNVNGVNRSASCVSQHVTAGSASGLPRRADTFGGFDSQQRTTLDFGHSVNSKVLFQMVIQLADLCGDMFQQMIPNLTPNIYNQTQHHVQRRMEELREAQQRLESEKAQWHAEKNSQSEKIASEMAELNSLKKAVTKQQEDVSQQREQLYRKLEKLESQGLRPYLDSMSPSALGAVEKPSGPNVSTRRPFQPPQIQTAHSVPAPTLASNKQTKQQLPLHLATRIGANNNNNTANVSFEPPKLIPRSSSVVMPPSKSGNVNSSFGDALSRLSSGSQIVRNSQVMPRAMPNPNNNSSQSTIQQILPLRLSEGTSNTNKTASLPRGVGTQSATNLCQGSVENAPMPQSNGSQRVRSSRNNSHFLQHSKSSASILSGAGGEQHHPTYLYGQSGHDRMGNYYRDSQPDQRGQMTNGYLDYPYQFQNNHPINTVNSVASAVHRRSGSSPVPMSSTVNHNPFLTNNSGQDDDHESTRILFL